MWRSLLTSLIAISFSMFSRWDSGKVLHSLDTFCGFCRFPALVSSFGLHSLFGEYAVKFEDFALSSYCTWVAIDAL